MKLSALLSIAALQYGCISWNQALAVMPKHTFYRLVRGGVVTRVLPSVYLATGFPDTWQQRAWAAVLSADGAALSHRSAARWWGLNRVASQKISITVPENGPREREGIDLRHSNQLEAFVILKDGLRITNPARTLVDLSSCISPLQIPKVIDDAFNKKLLKLAEIEHCLDAMITKGRSKISIIREQVELRSETDERLDSHLERKALKWIRESELPEPTGQHRVISNGSAYILDLCYPDLKIDIEPDGPHHLLPTVAAYDRRRDSDLNLDGWLVKRVPPEMEKWELLDYLRSAIKVRQK